MEGSPISTTGRWPELGGENRTLERAFAAREPWAFEAAYRLHAPQLLGAALQVLRNRDDADDCVHDVLTRLWQRGHAYRPERGSLGAFLVVCVRNAALSRTRKEHNRARIASGMPEESAYEDTIGDPIERERIARALEALPESQRRAVDLAYYRQMTHEEIAREVQAPLGTVKSRLSSALRALHAALEKP